MAYYRGMVARIFILSITLGVCLSESCDFEKDTCGWTQSRNDKFDWTRKSGKTGTAGTGATTDHTSLVKKLNVTTPKGPCVFPFNYLGRTYNSCLTTGLRAWCAITKDYDKDSKWGYCNPVGYYMYIEASGKKTGDNAILLSKQQASGTKCLSFWYHMYGPHVDKLMVSTFSNTQRGPTLWQRKGTKGNQWLNSNVTINANATLANYQIVIEATRGNNFRGDISIDDIVLTDGSCDYNPGGSGGLCTFDDIKLCGYTQDKTDQLDWTRNRGRTGSRGTGPSTDHTTGTSQGYYVYIETSRARRNNKARLMKDYTGLAKGGSCLVFWYHMFGSHQGTLKVYANSTTSKPIFSVSGQQGNLWLKAQATINTTRAKIIFEGTTKSGYRGDMALDDIQIQDGVCTIPGECTFQNGFCTWYNLPNSQGDDFDWLIGKGQTQSSYTGPKTDRFGDTNGKYVFLESSSPRKTGDKTRLVSELFNQTSASSQCFIFYYHMFGQSVGSFNIYVNASGSETLIWSLSGNKGTRWQNGQVNVGRITVGSSYKIIVEGVRGTSYTGDIAIDDFTFKQGSCPIVPSTARPGQVTTTTTTTVARPTTFAPGSSFNCDFETSICSSWIQDKTDQLDWQRGQGSTSSFGTGPTVDHTLKNAYGKYAYLEVTGQSVNKAARLISQRMPATNANNGNCLKFWYHMYGPHINTLSVYVVVGSNYTGQIPFWRRTGTQGNKWIEGQVTLYAGQPFSAVFEATVGTSYQGDIAIDDISLVNGKCVQPTTTCTFENDNCGYINDQINTEFTWTRISKATSSFGTGPKLDHTLQSSSGFYLYTEATGRTYKDTARVLSPVIKPTTGSCLQFWYHMYGTTMGTLNIYKKDPSGRLVKIWTESGNQGNAWRTATVTVSMTRDFQLAFEGVIGRGYQSDIALDDIKYTAGACPPPGYCDFEGGLCNYINSKNDDFDWIVGSAGTASFFTGPRFDHTTGLKNGSYVFLESSNPRKLNDTAVLVSQQFNAVAGQKRCLNFWYHMYGSSIGSLEIIYRVYSGSRPERVLWKLSGQQHNSENDPWKNARVPIDMNADHSIEFRGTIGLGYTGDIALDDIQLTSLGCTLTPKNADPNPKPSVKPTTLPVTRPTTVAPSLLGCNFETDICQLTQSNTDTFNWTRVQGYTHTKGSGPSNDHTYGKGAVGPNGPGSLKHTSGQCIHISKGAWVKPASNSPLVLYFGCGQDRLEFQLSGNKLKLTKYNMCVGLQGGGTTSGTAVVIKDSCTDKWSMLSNGAFQHSSGLCMSPKGGRTSDNTPIVVYTNCVKVSKQFTFIPTMGHYMYIETSSPRKINDTARIISPATSNPKCLNFWYHMYGSHVNKLNVYIKSSKGNFLGNPVWSKYGSHGDLWKPAHVSMNYRGSYQYVIEAVRGNGYAGDIAIDDITVSDQCNGPLECSFEETRPPICGWKKLQGKFDWSIGQGKTSSINTGPLADHTYNDAIGKYLYIETSGRLKKGDNALIQSPRYPGNGKTNGQCFQFWYHMTGASIGTLNLYILKTGSQKGNPVWSKSGEQGQKWQIGQVTVYSQSFYNLIFEGIRGSSYTGDIAIDDLKMMDGPCNKQATCDFEKAGRCTWTNSPLGDDFDWIIASGNTPSLATGPSTDHTLLNGDGKYIYIEASAKRANQKARLSSEHLNKMQNRRIPYCLRFWYHMKGSGVGTLNLYIKIGPGSTNERLTWRLSGNQGNVWREGTAPIYSRYDFNLIFEGVTGNNVRGDISIDDIVYSIGKCPIQPIEADPKYVTTVAPTTPTTTLSPKDLLGCTFEGNNICQWTQAINDKFNWTLNKGSTSTTDSGPTSDHTTGNKTGTYLYIETSSPQKDGDSARLQSPVIPSDTKSGKSHCFTFWYHMYGPHINALNVYRMTGGSPLKLWTRVGDNGDMWRYAQVDLVSKTLDYQVVIEGLRGKDYQGDISIDDIDIKDGLCPPPALCDFEHDMCKYIKDTTGDFDWSRNKGATTSRGTGPSVDHTLQTPQGYYIYTEASGRRRFGDKARLIGQVLPDNRPYCLQFWFHMRGYHIGQLNIYVKTPSGGNSLGWQRKGNHGDQWKIARVNIRPRAGRRIVIEGVRGLSFLGDIAVDDLKLSQGYCPPPGDCSFDNGLCSWRNVKTTSDDFDWILNSGSTSSIFTGPAKDHTSGNGKYVYIEASNSGSGDRAQLISEDFYPTYGRCMQFWAHMKGAGVGELSIYIRGQNATDSSMTKIWTLSGEQGNGDWFSCQAPISSASDYQIVIEATRGNTYIGDIAVDDVIFTNFRCVNHPQGSVATTPKPTTTTTTLAPTLAPNHYTCNFTLGKCNWNDDPSAHFNWTRTQGKTTSVGTGPQVDHTTGASGWYVFIETSHPRKANDSARLISDMIPSTNQMCLQFWYHMYGDHIANLTVYSNSSGMMSVLWQKSGTQGPNWKHATIDVSSASKFQLVLEGIKGSGYRGDIALDDISLNDGACPPQAECSFEESDLCGWSNMGGDNFDWTRDNAGTSSLGTGPRTDHTYGTAAGFYMYIETSNPRTKGHLAWLKSKEYKPTLGRCLSFWYHMLGQHIGSLNVRIYTNGSRSAPIWTLSGNQGGYWRPARVTIASSVKHNILFEGKTGASYRGDIAIDDVMVTDGPCPDPGNCDFERDLCGYTNRDYIDQFDWMLGNGKTSSVYTGPKTDHTVGDASGRYLFIESSWPRQTDEKAITLSETIPVKGNGKCVRFWFHMYGQDIGTLRVLMRVGYAISESVVWELSGNQGNKWQYGQAPMISGGQNIEIRFEGIRGRGYKGDIAIDDIAVVPYGSGCRVQPRNAVSKSTNFELGLDLWKQSTTDQFDWTRHKGYTGSVGTGPTVDHTTNTTKGYYMYIETSFPRKANETASLVSPPFIGNNTKVNYCFWFAYHMYGPHVDKLRVYTYSQGQKKPAVWQRTGSQGPNWRHGEAQITVLQTTQVVVEASRGTSFKGDIAIDDLDFYYGDCISSGVCTFEGANICGWWINQNLPIKWQRASGSTLSTKTGPKADHTYGTPMGHYMYIETSSGAVNSKAEMWSSWYWSSGQQCVQFFYHMFGNQIGSLTILASYSGSNYRYVKFYKQGNQNDTWNMGTVTINRKGWFRLLVRATKGNGYQGDIAVDDFRIRDGACPAEGDCDFEHADTCDWQQETKGDQFDWMIGSGRTGSFFTGPSIDHTTQSAGGYYAFVEASSPRKPGDKSIMKSTRFSPTASNGKCMSFWYHMYGSSIGELRVYFRTLNGDKTLKTELMWKLSGNQGRQWNQGRIGIRMNADYQILFEAVRGTSYTGDIALDDITFTNSYCSFIPMTAWPPGKSTPLPPTTTTTVGPTTGNLGNDCNFDVTSCSPPWTTNSSRTSFLWKRHKGSTASAGTGPKQDHTKGTNQGSYVYLEASSPARPNDTAWFSNPKVDDSMDSCMTFWYHMYGPHVGSLNIYLSYAGNIALVWQRSGTQGDRWRHGQIFIKRSTRNQPLTVIFEGVRGTAYAGDIALDDVSFSKNACPMPRECTFESNNWNDGSNGMCGWTQSNKDDFDWRIGSATTPSVLTGPRADHTLGTAVGHYLYIETSYPRRYGQKARVVSKPIQATRGQCFTFWYHMYGRTIGNMTLFTKSGTGVERPIWSRASSEGNRWRPAMATIKGTSQFQLIFEGTVGRSYTGDIAIDDILILDGECPRAGDCDFENFGMCTYQQAQKDEFDWILAHGGTSSWRTGPAKDNTKGDATGHYMFIESSAPRKTGDRATIVSQLFQPTSSTRGRCLQFYRHMYGPHIGELNVYTRVDSTDTKIWTDSGNQGNSWIQSQVPVFSKQPFRLVFEAVRGTSYQGDIALDDINFSNNFSPCTYIPTDSIPPTIIPTTITPADSNCTFDNGLCRWTQRTDDKFDWTLKKGKTGSTGTGPLGDHTSGLGQYVFIEASHPQKENDTAVLRSPSIKPPSNGVCFRFSYHMHGPHVGTLNIYRVIGRYRVKIFTRSGTQGNIWRTGQVNIRGVRTIFNIEVEGIRGISYAGDISVDDFILTEGSCKQPALCDFEQNSCYFKNYRLDKFDWILSNDGTPSLGTGPRTDHTTGTKLGRYFYIEASWPRKKGENAILYSNNYFSATKGARCLNFWYHMTGSGVDTLNIYQRTTKSTPIWTQKGDQGDVWKHGRVTIGKGMRTNYRIYIEGIRGTNYQGDIAIDDVWVDEYPCPAPGACDFESQSFCTWSQVKNGNSNKTGFDDFDWELQSGSTPSIGTGPKVDHTKGTPVGTYAYIEVTSIKPGKKAQLISEKMKATKGKCLSLWYHMLGSGIGNLNIYTQDQNGKQLVKTISGNQGNAWNPGEVGLHSRNDFYVIIEAEHGTSYTGDISLDDLNIKDGNCVGLCSSVPATARVSCGPSSVTASSCVLTYGCCYDDTLKDQGMPSCFQHPGTCAAVPIIARSQCGYTGISSYYCGRRGCCYDASSNGPKCYSPLSKPTDFPTTLAPPTTPAPSIYDCDFEKDNCNYVNLGKDQLDWRKNKGETGSYGTGPKTDHTQGNEQGSYLYVETSYAKENDTANLRTPQIIFAPGNNGTVCVRFWYHMFGQHVGAFNIFQSTSTTVLGKLVWQRKGSLIDEWVYGHIAVPRRSAFYMIFQAVRGPGYKGDVAIDDISFVNGPCPPTMTCGFENSGYCGWTQDASDQFDWTKGTGNTTSVYTGPKWDKTYETGFGHYLYIEGSNPRQPGDIARIESFAHAPTKGKCFEFYYNMFGNGIGTLNIYIRRGKKLDPKPLWVMTGEQGREWLRGLVTVEEDSTNWKLVIEAVRGGNFNSDIAIDELTFTDGACVPRGDCDFEDKNACGYSNDVTNQVDWLVYSGSTPSYHTGPTIDHTTQTITGMYLYMEASSPAQRGDKGRFVSEELTVNPNFKFCVDFWYHMFGDGAGALRVQAKYKSLYGSGRKFTSTKWSMEGNQGNEWRHAQVNITMHTDFQLIFEGEIGTGQSHQSDIALDDIVVAEGLCPMPKPLPTPNPCLRKCKNNKCISSDKVCDFYPDCAQGDDPTDDSDEHGCDGCDFEKDNCFYNDTSKGNFKWFRKNGRTTSYLTGPSTDHTKGDASGYYAYVEASVGKNYDLAIFNSPTLKQAASTCTMKFWYHMYGTNIGELTIYVVQGYRMTSVWSLNGEQGNKWQQGVAYINRRNGPFSIQFIASRRNSFKGDIAIDDITFENCALPAPAKYCNTKYSHLCFQTKACVNTRFLCDYTDDCGDGSDELNCYYKLYPIRCNFEFGMCSWNNMKDDQFDFIRHKGFTDSSQTGPKFDHTKGTTSGYYLYAEASWPRKEGDKARVKSVTMNPTSSYAPCYLRFYYHMIGQHVGTLRVKIRQCEDCKEVTVFENTKETIDNWVRKVTTLRSSEPFQIIIEAEIGSGYAGDISLDDISFEGCSRSSTPIPTSLPTTKGPITTTPCSQSQIYCSADAKCIDVSLKCDHRNDCSDGEDERMCGACDFEQDTCGYNDVSTGNIEFQRTQPLRTFGPKRDATKNSTKGYFMMSQDGLGGIYGKGTLMSAKLTPTAPQCKLQMSYYSNDSYAGVYAGFYQDVNGKNVYSQLFWKNVQKPSWQTWLIGIGSRPNGWQLQFQAGSKNVAFDDITLVDCAFSAQTSVCNYMQIGCTSGGCFSQDQECDFSNDCGDGTDEREAICSNYKERCDFETDACNWYNNQDDDFEWTRTKSKQLATGQGPQTDHTSGLSSGTYMTIPPATNTRVDKAQLLSAIFLPSKGCVMRFWYYMLDGHVAHLSIKMKTSAAASSPMITLWSLDRDQGDMWKKAVVSIPYYVKNYQVVIEAERAHLNYTTPLAIDDVSFSKQCMPSLTATLDPRPVTPSPPPGCKSGEYKCGEDSQCISAEKYCNFVPDCANKADELSCPGKCTFEDKDSKTCKWYNSWFYDKMDWTLHQGETPSNDTGPPYDHTLGTGKGHYIYMEAGQRKNGKYPNAHFVSPMYYKGAYNCKFTFWYNMYHYDRKVFTDVKLNVFYRRNGRDTKLWSRTRSTGNKWKQATVQLPPCPSDFRMVFEGFHYSSSKTDAAIDDWAFVDCAEKTAQQCSSDQFQCKKTQQCILKTDLCDNERNCCDGSDEDLDTICKGYTKYDWQYGLNGWTQLKNDSFDFSTYSGRTPSAFTGPKTDHTYQEENGRYLYAEASGKGLNDSASLGSPTIAATNTLSYATTPCTMSFWYHMRGRRIGTLNVYLATTYGNIDNLIWAKSGDQGKKWNKAQMTLNSNADFQIIIQAKMGTSFIGDIALDDVVFSNGCTLNGKLLPGAPTPPPIDPCLPKFQCRLSGACISQTKVCDFFPDCPGSTDEEYSVCGYPQNFEKSVAPWKYSKHESYEFQVWKGATQTFGTGPKTDATGNKDGSYIYFETSNRNKDQGATIMSPVISSTYSECSVEFSYHMFGIHTGILTVQLQPSNGDDAGISRLFELSGSQNKDWVKTKAYIGRRKSPFFLNFTATSGGGSRGDIAIDEINFTNCFPPKQCGSLGNDTGLHPCANSRCVSEDKVCDLTDDCGDASDESVNGLCLDYIGCTFESKEFDPCNMTQDKSSDDFDWTYNYHYSNSYNTGPTIDHTLGTWRGHYYYIEASGKKAGDKARLLTLPVQAKKGGQCTMRFYYHMFGKHVKDLNVYTLTSGKLETVFSVSGNFGYEWKFAEVDLSNNTERFQIVFEGIVGQSYLSDIAIDDIIFSPDCLTNSSRIYPTVIPCSKTEFTCRTLHQCINGTRKCDGTEDCKDGSDEELCGGTTGKSTGSQSGHETSVLAASIVGGIVVLLVIVIVLYIIVKRKREKKLHLFSVFYDPTKQGEQESKEKRASTSGKEKELKPSNNKKPNEGVANPIFDEDNMAEFSMGDVDTDMFPDDQFQVTMDAKGGATSMANPLYQDPYMEDDDSPLSNF